jgi:geranylgeranyl transferase type-2 subunit beta
MLVDFILKCQDSEDGGISDKPGNVRDVYHTCFGCAGVFIVLFNVK